MEEFQNKAYRQLAMYEAMSRGGVVQKAKEAARFHVSEKTIQRDLKDIEYYVSLFSKDRDTNAEVRYEPAKKGHVLVRSSETWLTQAEVLAICKILLESRAFPKEELESLLNKLIAQLKLEDQKYIRELIRNEEHHYKPLLHNKPLIELIWDLNNAVLRKQAILLNYRSVARTTPKERVVYPVGLMFSEYYFYLVAFNEASDFSFPISYRLDRIASYQVLRKGAYRIPEAKRFEEGLFRRQIAFMQPGELMRVRFRFWGVSLEAVLDRLPNAEVISQDERGTIVEAHIFGGGIRMWLLSQMPFVEVLAPAGFRAEMRRTLEESLRLHLPAD